MLHSDHPLESNNVVGQQIGGSRKSFGPSRGAFVGNEHTFLTSTTLVVIPLILTEHLPEHDINWKVYSDQSCLHQWHIRVGDTCVSLKEGTRVHHCASLKDLFIDKVCSGHGDDNHIILDPIPSSVPKSFFQITQV